jgi:hypothetical protein
MPIEEPPPELPGRRITAEASSRDWIDVSGPPRLGPETGFYDGPEFERCDRSYCELAVWRFFQRLRGRKPAF